jgi:hypothetical protein
MNDPGLMATAHVYDASGEQVQYWHYHNNLQPWQEHSFITLDTNLTDMDAAVMEQAIAILVERHESLRTFFLVIDGHVKQCVVPYGPQLFSPLWLDLRAAANKEQEVTDVVRQCKYVLRQMDTPPLFRCCIFRVADNAHYIYFILHHIIADEWSSAIIYRELTSAYLSLKKGQRPQLAPLKIQLKDYARWQREWQQKNGAALRKYWGDKLAALTGSVRTDALYCDERLQVLSSAASATYCYPAPPTQQAQVKGLLASGKTSIWAIMSASLSLLFFHLRKGEQPLIAMPVISRNIPGADALIGCLIGGAYLYQPVNPDLSVDAFIKAVFLEFIDAAWQPIHNHENLALDETALRLRTDVYANFVTKEIVGDLALPAQEGPVHHPRASPAYYALSCMVHEYNNGFFYAWTYNLQLYSLQQMERVAEAHEKILSGMCGHPGMPVAALLATLDPPL